MALAIASSVQGIVACCGLIDRGTNRADREFHRPFKTLGKRMQHHVAGRCRQDRPPKFSAIRNRSKRYRPFGRGRCRAGVAASQCTSLKPSFGRPARLGLTPCISQICGPLVDRACVAAPCERIDSSWVERQSKLDLSAPTGCQLATTLCGHRGCG